MSAMVTSEEPYSITFISRKAVALTGGAIRAV